MGTFRFQIAVEIDGYVAGPDQSVEDDPPSTSPGVVLTGHPREPLEGGEVSGADWEGLGEAAWWSAHPDESSAAFARAYASYASEGSPGRASVVASRLAHGHAERMGLALWSGWRQRGVRLLSDQPA